MFNFTGAAQNWTVPAGVTEIYVDMAGAAGGSSGGGGTSGSGARVQAMLNVSSGESLGIDVGGQNGWNGGAPGGTGNGGQPSGANGGGASDIMVGGGAPASRVMVAGGGGGGGSSGSAASGGDGGPGGDPIGGNGANGNGANTAYGGGGGTTTGGGTGGALCGLAANGGSGGLDSGGAGGNAGNVMNNGGGGGGGGGLYGGGGGGGSCYDDGGGGGGGGSSYSSGADTSGVAYTSGYESGNGYVMIIYLLAGSPTPVSPAIDIGQSLKLSASSSGGTPPYSYQWESGSSPSCTSDTPVSGATNSTYTASPTAGTYYCYSVTDSSPHPLMAYSSADRVTVDPTLSANPITPVSPAIASGQSVNLTAHPSGGTQPYGYQWYSGTSSSCISDTKIPGAISSNYSASPTSNTTYCYTVVDSSDGTPSVFAMSTTDAVTLTTLLVVHPATPDNPTIDDGQSITLTASASGGTAPYAYEWYSGSSDACSNDSAITGATALTYSASPASNTYYCYSVIDSSPSPETGYSATDLVTVDPQLSAAPITPASPSISAGQSVILSANPSGGAAPYGYQWYSGKSASCSAETKIAGATAATYTAAPTSNTSYCYTVTDASTGSPSAQATSTTDEVTLGKATGGFPVINSFTVTPVWITLGSSATFNVTATGGTLPYRYSYAGLPPDCASNSTRSLACTPAYPGQYNVTSTVTDAHGDVARSSPVTLLVVYPAGYPSITSFVVSPPNITLGSSTTLKVSVTGGAAPYTYVYIDLPAGCLSANNSRLSCVPTASGVFSIQVEVTDTKSHTVAATAGLTVGEGSSSSLSISSFSAIPNPVVAGSNTTLRVVVSGGTAPYSFTYTGLPSGCASSNTSSILCKPSTTGNFSVVVTVRDSMGNHANGTLHLSVTSNGNGGTSIGFGSVFPYLLLIVIAALIVIVIVLVARRRSRKQRPAEQAAVSAVPASLPGVGAAFPPAEPRGPPQEEWKETDDDGPARPGAGATSTPGPSGSEEWSE